MVNPTTISAIIVTVSRLIEFVNLLTLNQIQIVNKISV